jgi:hypothetical protein
MWAIWSSDVTIQDAGLDHEVELLGKANWITPATVALGC